jgi:hypothetical protein
MIQDARSHEIKGIMCLDAEGKFNLEKTIIKIV